MRSISFFSLVLAANLFAISAFAKTNVYLSTATVSMGDTVELIFESDKKIESIPNLDELKQYVKILSTSQSSNTSIINGSYSQTHKISFKIYPLKTGTINIPSFNFKDGTTAPLTLTVTESGSSTSGETPQTSGSISFETRIIPDTIYEGQVAIYQADVYENARLNDGRINLPQLQNISLTPLDNDKSFSKTVDGVRMNFIQKDYLLTPQKTGVFQIPPSELSGYVPDPNKRNRTNPQINDLFRIQMMGLDPFSQPQKPVFLQSNPTQLTVHEKPADWTGWWFASDKVTLSQEFKIPEKIYEGDTIERTLTLTAQYIDSAKLPLISHPQTDDLTVFENQENRYSTIQDDKLISTEIRSFILVPQKAGEYILPPIRIEYFNTSTKTKDIVQVESKKISVLKKQGIAAVNTPPSQNEVQEIQKVKPVEQSLQTTPLKSYKNIYISIAFILISSIISLFVLLIKRRLKKITLSQIKTTDEVSNKKKKKKPLPDLYPF